jgi:hypothetical protein
MLPDVIQRMLQYLYFKQNNNKKNKKQMWWKIKKIILGPIFLKAKILLRNFHTKDYFNNWNLKIYRPRVTRDIPLI